MAKLQFSSEILNSKYKSLSGFEVTFFFKNFWKQAAVQNFDLWQLCYLWRDECADLCKQKFLVVWPRKLIFFSSAEVKFLCEREASQYSGSRSARNICWDAGTSVKVGGQQVRLALARGGLYTWQNPRVGTAFKGLFPQPSPQGSSSAKCTGWLDGPKDLLGHQLLQPIPILLKVYHKFALL